MRFLTIGAGALGGYYGGMLLRGGVDVTFLVRPRRMAQLAERGLVIKTPDGEFRTPVKTVSAEGIDGSYDVVLVTCKAYDLDGAIDDFAPALASDGAVLPVMNGINHIAELSDRLGAARVLGGVASFSVVLTPEGDILKPGVGKGQTSFGELTGERSVRCEEIGAALVAGGVQATISDNIVAEMWAKFTGIAAAAAISTLTRARAGEIAVAPAGAAFVAAALDETARVTTAEPPRDTRRLPRSSSFTAATTPRSAPTPPLRCCTMSRTDARPRPTTSLATSSDAPIGSASRFRSCTLRCAICRFTRHAEARRLSPRYAQRRNRSADE